MVMVRGEVWWAELVPPRGSEPGYRRPVLIVQSDAFNKSRIGTVMTVAITTNLSRGDAPGNVRISKGTAGLPKSSVANVAHVMTLNREDLTERLGHVPPAKMTEVDSGLRLALALG
jgi:mRNA interferase MazF